MPTIKVKAPHTSVVQLTSKDVEQGVVLPEYVQLELELNPLQEGEVYNASRDSSIRIQEAV